MKTSEQPKARQLENGHPRPGQPKAGRPKLRISYREANRIRFCLLSEQETLSSREVGALIKILDDVYPRRRNQQNSFVGPLLIGIGIGLMIAIGWLIWS